MIVDKDFHRAIRLCPREERKRRMTDMQEENDLLRRLNEALSIKIKDLQEDHESPVKMTSKVRSVVKSCSESMNKLVIAGQVSVDEQGKKLWLYRCNCWCTYFASRLMCMQASQNDSRFFKCLPIVLSLAADFTEQN